MSSCPHPRSSPPPTPRLPHSRKKRLRRRPAEKPREERDGGVGGTTKRRFPPSPLGRAKGAATVV